MPTKVQITIAPSSNNTFANFLNWAGTGGANNEGIAGALNTLGFVKQTDTYTAQWANGTTIGDTARATAAGSLSAANVFPTTTANARAGKAGAAFKGAWVTLTSYSVGDVVTDSTTAAIVYVCTTANSDAAAPLNNLTKWSPYWMEIWKMSAGGLTDIYIKIEYGCTATQTFPDVFIQLGTAYSANSGVINGSGNFSQAEQVCNAASSITTLVNELVIVGDGAKYFGLLLWRNTNNDCLYVMERSISGTVAAAPVYNSSYVTYCVCPNSVTLWRQQSLFLSGSPVTAVRTTSVSTLALNLTALSYVTNNQSPAFPVFPMPGYPGNPLTILIALVLTDAPTEGTSITSTVYGATHTYLTTKTARFNGLGNAAASSQYAVGIRFE